MIAPLDNLDLITYSFYHTGTLVTKYHSAANLVLNEVYIGVTDTRRCYAHQHFVVSWTFHLDGFNFQMVVFMALDSNLDRKYIHGLLRLQAAE